MALLLERSGYDIHHEVPGTEGCVSWSMAVDSYSPWGPASHDLFEHTFHQVRNPLNVISSWMVNLSNLERDEWVFIRKHIPSISPNDTPLVSAVKYWIYWNRLAESKAEWRYKIEELESILPEFMDRSGIVIEKEVLDQLSKHYNSWKKITTPLSWNDLKEGLPRKLYKELEALALKYGYSITLK